jgi:hypothetical protein
MCHKVDNTDVAVVKGQGRALTVAEFLKLAEVPPEIEWFANLRNPNTRKAYEHDLRGGLAVYQVQACRLGRLGTGGRQQPPDLRQQVVQPRELLFVGRQGREGGSPVPRHQARGLFERGNLQDPLPQGQRGYCCIAAL